MDSAVLKDFPSLETERLLLVPMTSEDRDIVFEFNSDPDNLRHVARKPFEKTEEGEELLYKFLSGHANQTIAMWTVKIKESGEKIGYMGYFNISSEHNKGEIGYGIKKVYWGRGYMSEAVGKLLKFGIERIKFHKIWGRIEAPNTASIKLLKRLGFEKEGVLRDTEYAHDRYFSYELYSLITEN